MSEPPLLNPEPPPKASELAWKRAMQPSSGSPKMADVSKIGCVSFAVLLFGVASVLLCGFGGVGYSVSRFDDSFAPGATANSVEKLEGLGMVVIGAAAGLAGLLVLVLAQLHEIGECLRRRS